MYLIEIKSYLPKQDHTVFYVTVFFYQWCVCVFFGIVLPTDIIVLNERTLYFSFIVAVWLGFQLKCPFWPILHIFFLIVAGKGFILASENYTNCF